MRLKLSLFVFAFLASPAAAQVCNFSNSGINFGTLTVSSAPTTSSTGTITATCTGRRNRTINICANIGSGTGGNDATASRRYMTFGTERIEYNLYQNNGASQVWGSYVWPYPPRPPAWSVSLNGNGTGTTQTTVFGRMYATTVSPGIFISNFSGGQTSFDYGYSNRFSCGTNVSARAVQVPFTAQVTNLGDCQTTTTPMDFGTMVNLNAIVDATNTVSVTCTNGVNYSVGLDNGTSGSTNPAARRMTAAGTTDSVTYGIYTNTGRTTPWGASAFSARGNGNPRIYTGYGRVPVQTTPGVANYSDRLTVTITY
jgi:spore coat protein U-like protein